MISNIHSAKFLAFKQFPNINSITTIIIHRLSHHSRNKFNQCEGSSWIPPTCFPASKDVSTIPIPLQYGIIAVYGFYKNPLTNGAIGSHPLYEAGNHQSNIYICQYVYTAIYIYISYHI